MSAAALLMVFVISDYRLQSILNNTLFRFLGRISYALYAMHLLVIGSISSAMYLILRESMGHGFAFFWVLTTGIIACLVSAAIVTKLIDEPCIKLCGRLDRLLASRLSQLGLRV